MHYVNAFSTLNKRRSQGLFLILVITLALSACDKFGPSQSQKAYDKEQEKNQQEANASAEPTAQSEDGEQNGDDSDGAAGNSGDQSGDDQIDDDLKNDDQKDKDLSDKDKTPQLVFSLVETNYLGNDKPGSQKYVNADFCSFNGFF